MSNYAERDAERAQRDDAVRRRMFRHQRRKAAESYALAASKVTMSDLDIMQDEILRSQVLVQSLRGLPTPVMDRSSQDTHTALRSLQVSRRTIEALREAQKLTEPDTLVVEGAARVSAQTLKDAIQNRLVASVDAQNVVRAPHAAREAQRVMDKADEAYCASQQALEDCTLTRQPIA